MTLTLISILKRASIYHQSPYIFRFSLEERLKLCLEVGEEIISETELLELLKNKDSPICYDGFEPSGRMHIAQVSFLSHFNTQGILKTINVNKLVDAGCIFVFWVADWFALLNNKMGGTN
jgi:tyrosyl-tRNA synthetase